MVSCDKIQRGITQYMDREILPKLPTWKSIALGTAAALYIRKLPEMVDSIPDSMGIKSEGMLDIDTVAEELKNRINGEVPVDIPVIGTMTFDRAEVDRILDYIRRA